MLFLIFGRGGPKIFAFLAPIGYSLALLDIPEAESKPPLWFCIISIGRPLNRFYSPCIVNLQGEKHVFFIGKTQLVPAGYVVNKNGLGGSVWVPNKMETPM